ncbi:MAG TPA: GTPase, partial [Planctomycetota bacterium]|nr:GTPase [Planctomycetota bacterium]
MLDDTIAAIASPPGPAARGVIRVSGPAAIPAGEAVLQAALPRVRAAVAADLPLRGARLPALALVMPAPGSYTGEDVVELHLPGGPALLQAVLDALFAAGARAATPGEFTRRAFERGRLSLAQAEAVADLIAAAGEQERRTALHALSGGLGSDVARVRGHVQDALALLESGLDFTEGETGAVDPEAWLAAIERAEQAVARARAALPEVAVGGELILLGAANAGKSSLCNALAGCDAVLVDPTAGTTRDVVAVRLAEGTTLLDAPGDLDVPAPLDAAALALRDRIAARAAAALLVIDATAPRVPEVPAGTPVLATVFTKVDLLDARAEPERAAALAACAGSGAPRPHLFVSSVRGDGLDALRAFLTGRGASSAVSLRRWHDGLDGAAE